MCRDNVLLKYDVPVKVKYDEKMETKNDKNKVLSCKIKIQNKEFYTINWMYYNGRSFDMEKFKNQWNFLRKYKEITQDSVKEKLNNTMEFRKFSLDRGIKNFNDYKYGNNILM
jgi:hypothetical protein